MTAQDFADLHGAVAVCRKPFPDGGWCALLDKSGVLMAATLRPGEDRVAVAPVSLPEAAAIVGLALAEPGPEWDGAALSRLVRGLGQRIADLEVQATQPHPTASRQKRGDNQDGAGI